MKTNDSDFSSHYSKPRLWHKLQKQASKIGSGMAMTILKLYYTARDPRTPKWARIRIYGALGYFILPIDAIPDFIPLTGYSDDAALLTLAVATLAFYISDESKKKAADKITQLNSILSKSPQS
ncbi:YkvA family protein [Pseudobdellovibrio exovorus]|uniref:DUF1232 domain-containing protein n=1 Tax=Pseudobdellovibrio exovorus JSS TaxID=1184267 RepID=M4VA80_9BACT|nr:YkvA family protein [Pseudobdellovibrio exovorus]AGH95375.1 hypothetical protein A11Q_1159 [Pseudobdellovibrio exovorus JSS]